MLFLLLSAGIWVHTKCRPVLTDWERSWAVELNDVNGGEKGPFILTHKSSSFLICAKQPVSGIPSAGLAACSSCYSFLINAGVRNMKVPSVKNIFLMYSAYARNKCLFTWQHGNFNIYHKHSTKYLCLAEYPTLYLSKINQGLVLFMPEWVFFLKILITTNSCALGRSLHNYHTFFLCLIAKKMKFGTQLKKNKGSGF